MGQANIWLSSAKALNTKLKLLESLCQLLLGVFVVEEFKVSLSPRENHHIDLVRKGGGLVTKDFSKPTLYLVSSHCVANFAAYSNSKTRSCFPGFRNKNYEVLSCALSALSHDAVETRRPQ